MGEVCEAARRVEKVARMERSEMRDGGAVGLRHPGLRFASSGLCLLHNPQKRFEGPEGISDTESFIAWS
jgi:hypothetical protein